LKPLRTTLSIAVVAALGLFPNLAMATPDQVDPDDLIGNRGDKIADTKEEVYGESHPHQHGGEEGHLPPTQENVELVAKVQLTNREDKISDVATLGNFAYLGEWAGGLTTPGCRGGVHVVNITNPTKPKKVAFLASHEGTYATEGVQALHLDTPAFTGDLLVVSNEACTSKGIGGLTLWDVTNPRKATLLSEHGGDYTNGDTFGVVTGVDPVAHQSHSAMAWQDGDNAYVIAIDNDEGLDLDFFNITDPRNPIIISETGLEEWVGVNVDAYGDFPTSHDFDVRFIDGQWYTMVSYWDAGWVLLNVDDPANPTLVDDYDYPDCDSFIGASGSDVDPRSCPPEGNAHQGEWNDSRELFLGTDEDFSPYRLLPIEVTENTTGTGTAFPQPAPGTEYEGGEFGWTVPVADIPDGILNGPTAYGGYGCDEDNQIPPATVLDDHINPAAASPEEKIVVLQRGPVGDSSAPYDACFFSIKVENAQDAGYDAVIVANHHEGSAFGDQPDSFFCGGQGHTFTITAHGTCSGHRSMHEFFGDPPNFGTSSAAQGYPEPTLNAKTGLVGPKVETQSFFDGWGYVRLFEAQPPFTEIDQLAIPEELQEAKASGFGDLTVHEVATGLEEDGDEDLAYFSWYSGGFRVAEFDETGIEEVGAFIDEGGNDFWGVQLTDKFINGRRVVALSDLDFGLYLFRYTG
jgi:hypothetical protein